MNRLCRTVGRLGCAAALALAAVIALDAAPAAADGGWRGGDRHWGHKGKFDRHWGHKGRFNHHWGHKGKWHGGWHGSRSHGWAWRQHDWRHHDGLGWDFDRRWRHRDHDLRWVTRPRFHHRQPWPHVGFVEPWPWVHSVPPIRLHHPPAFHFGDPSFTVIVPLQ